MMDSVKPAPSGVRLPIHERMMNYRNAHPDHEWYAITNELEAAEMLLVIAASLKATGYNLGNVADTAAVKDSARRYRRAAANGMAMAVLKEISPDHSPLEFYGLKIAAGVLH